MNSQAPQLERWLQNSPRKESSLVRALRVLGRLGGRALLYLTLTVGGFLFVIPFFWMLSTSIKPEYQVFMMPPVWIPTEPMWSYYIAPWSQAPWTTFYRNTSTLVVFNIIGTTFSSAIVAYAFARLRFHGRGILFLVILSTMMLPIHVTIIPRYVLFTKLKWTDTLKPLIVPTFFGSPFNIFLLRQFFMTIHPELDDAAKIDGCSILGTFWRIILPLARPALGVVAIFAFTFNWNDFLGPVIYLSSPENFPVSVGLRLMQTQLYGGIQDVMAMTVVSIIPVLAVFFIAQRYFIQGIVLTGVKG